MDTKVMRGLGLVLVLSLGIYRGDDRCGREDGSVGNDAHSRYVYQSQCSLGGRRPDRSQ